MTIKSKLNDTEQQAAILGISPKTMVKARSTGYPKIPYIKIGKTVRYDPDAVNAWLVKNSHNNVED